MRLTRKALASGKGDDVEAGEGAGIRNAGAAGATKAGDFSRLRVGTTTVSLWPGAMVICFEPSP